MLSKIKAEIAAIKYCKDEGLKFQGYAGGGAFKAVYRIISPDGKNYALKIVLNPDVSSRTKREIESLLKCDHQNICKIHKTAKLSVEDADYHLIIEDYCSGGTLTDYCNRNGLLSLEQALVIGKNITDALAHLNDLNLVHRDIKPDNIMLRNSIFDPVLVDFGLVRDIDATSLTQSWVLSGPGTPYFASPEQLNNDKTLIDWRSDQFSLGVLLSLCFLGIHPYQLEQEPLYSSSTVERVASRTKCENNFVKLATDSNLPCLIRMTSPWPIERYRNPHELKKQFEEVYNDCISSNGTSFRKFTQR